MLSIGGILILACYAVALTIGWITRSSHEQKVAQEEKRAEPGNASRALYNVPLSGVIGPEQTEPRPTPPAPRPVPVPGPLDRPPPASTPEPKVTNDLRDAHMRRMWERYYSGVEEAYSARAKDARTAAEAGLANAAGRGNAIVGTAQAGTPSAGSVGPTGGIPVVASTSGGSLGQTPRPGTFDQGPNNGQNAWLQASVQQPYTPFSLERGDTVSCAVTQGIRSEVPGMFKARVRQPVTNGAGQVMIPAGAELVGVYDQATGYGQESLAVGFTDIVYPPIGPQGTRYSLAIGSVPGTDAQGSAGFRDQVDRHTGRVLFSALVSGLAGGASAAAGAALGGAGAMGSLGSMATSDLSMATRNLASRGVNSGSTIEIRTGYPCAMMLTQKIAFPGYWVDGRGWQR